MKTKEKLSKDIHIQKAFNKASSETIKLIELALENKLAFIYLKGVRDVIDSAIKIIEEKNED